MEVIEKLLPWATALIGPAIAAIATAVVVWVREAIARRDETFRRRDALATATQEVQFIQAWVAAARELNMEDTRSWVDEQVGADLAQAYALVAQARPSDASLSRKWPSLREVTSAAFLWRKLASPWARAGLIIYYVLIFNALAMFAVAINPNSGFDFFEILSALLVLLPVSVGIIWLWRRFLLWIDQRYRATKQAIPANDPLASRASANTDILVLTGGMWREGILIEWRPNGVSWAGRVRFGDGTVTDWVPAEYLRRISEPHVDVQSKH